MLSTKISFVGLLIAIGLFLALMLALFPDLMQQLFVFLVWDIIL